jgi:hypothetical protein
MGYELHMLQNQVHRAAQLQNHTPQKPRYTLGNTDCYTRPDGATNP